MKSSEPITTPDEELKREMKRVIDCAFPIQDGGGCMRFSFRVSPETFTRWKELAA